MKTGKVFLQKLFAFLLLCQLLPALSSAQELIGYNYNNYLGVNGIVTNPASIAASRYKVHFNLLTVNAYGGSNAYAFSSKKFFQFNYNYSRWTEGQDYRKLSGSDPKNGWAQVDVLGPSVLINLKHRDAIGFSTRFRTLVNAYNFSEGAFNLMGQPDSTIFGTNFSERNVRFNASSFADFGITYAKILKNSGKNFVKGGFTVKYVQGIASAYTKIDSLNVNLQDISSIQQLNGGGSLLYSESIDRFTQAGAKMEARQLLNTANGTVGLDLGLVYERRSGKFAPRKATPKTIFRTIPYDYRFSLAVTDFAFSPIKYTAGSQSATYRLSADNVEKDTFNVKEGESSDVYLQRLQLGNLITKQAATGTFEMPLPMSVRTNFDWHVSDNFFINADALISLRGAGSKKEGNNYISTLSLTPRFEKQWYSLYTPVSVNHRNELNWGAGFRLGPLFAGSGSVLSNLVKTELRNTDVHVGVSIPIYQGVRTRKVKKEIEEEEAPAPKTEKAKPSKSKDRDNDGTPDDKDACPDAAGPVADNGCPDKDKDGIADNLDLCPAVPGMAKYKGCPVPDTDKDGVTDEADKCLTVAGPVTNNGCPEIKQEVKKTVASAAKNLFFVSGKATIQTRSYPALNKLGSILRADSTLFLDIEGHTDNVGNDALNLRLSQQRAAAARQYLVGIGIEPARITTTGYGETQPIAPNTTKEGRAQNRRIVLKIRNY